MLRDGETATAQEIIDYCRTRMARYKVPKQVKFRSELPRSLFGKVLRRLLLQEEIMERDVRAAAAAEGDAAERAS